MKQLDDYIDLLTLKGGESFTTIRLFSETSLRDTCYIKISHLYDALKFAPPKQLMLKSAILFTFKENADGSRRFTHDLDISDLTYQDLIDECEEVKLFCRKYFPELAI